MAIKKIFGDKPVNIETDKMRKAREAYRSLVFDIRRETLDTYRKKIQIYHKEALVTEDFKRMKELDSMIQYLEERITTIESSLESDDLAEIELRGQRKLSYMEIWQKRQAEFRKFNQKA